MEVSDMDGGAFLPGAIAEESQPASSPEREVSHRDLDLDHGMDVRSRSPAAPLGGQQQQSTEVDLGSLISFSNLENVMKHMIKKFEAVEINHEATNNAVRAVQADLDKRASLSMLDDVAGELRNRLDSFQGKIQGMNDASGRLSDELERMRAHGGQQDKKLETCVKEKIIQDRILRETQDALLDKVAVSELNMFEAKFAGYTTKIEHQEVLNLLSQYTRTDVSERIAESVRALGTRFEDYTRTASIDFQFQEVRDWVADELQNYAKFQATLQKFDDFESKMKAQTLSFERMHAMVDDKARALSDRITSIYSEFHADINERALETDLRGLHNEMSKYAVRMDVEVFQQDCIPKLKFCVDSIKHFDDRLTVQDNAIQRVDEVLLDKAGKYDIVVLNSRIEQCATKDKAHQEFGTMWERLDWMNKRLEQYIDAEHDRLARFKPPDYTKIFEEIQTRIALKADKADLVEIYQLKANRIDADELSKLQDLIHRQLEYLSVTTFGLAKLSLTGEDKESRTIRQQQKSQVLRQSEALWHWVIHNESPPNLDTLRPGANEKGRKGSSQAQGKKQGNYEEAGEHQLDQERRHIDDRKRAQLERKLGVQGLV